MFEVMRTIIVWFTNCLKQVSNSNKKAPTLNVTITINAGDNNKVDVSIEK